MKKTIKYLFNATRLQEYINAALIKDIPITWIQNKSQYL